MPCRLRGQTPIQDQRKENGNVEAHPLARGEHSDRTTQNDLQQGSSPLARGTRTPVPSPVLHRGLIPARAGNTRPSSQARFQTRAHPRSRGEHMSGSSHWLLSSGSSPLTRRNTTRRSVVTRLPGAHPRSRGEHAPRVGESFAAPGSSPLARGTRGHLLHPRGSPGLIPARAGNTGLACLRTRESWAHPRSRGEHGMVGLSGCVEKGSSPLARGTPSRTGLTTSS